MFFIAHLLRRHGSELLGFSEEGNPHFGRLHLILNWSLCCAPAWRVTPAKESLAFSIFWKKEISMIANTVSRHILLFTSSVFITTAAAIAQANPGSMPQPSTPSQLPSTAAGAPATDNSSQLNMQAIDDQDFVRKALQGGDAEVQLGQLAEQKSQSSDVKQFGQKMVQDHSQLGDQVIKPLAKQLGVKEPNGLSKKDKQLVASLEGLSGPQFDQEYIKAMVKDHKQDLKEFTDETQMSQDPNVKKAALEGCNVITQHLELIERIAQTHNVPIDSKSK